MVFPTFFNLSLNLAIRSSWSEPQSAFSLVFADCIELLHLLLQRISSVWFSIDHLVMSMCRVFSCVVGRWCLLWPVRSLGNLWPASFVLQGQICLLLQVSLNLLLLHSTPLGHLFGMLVLEGLVGLHRTDQLQLLKHYWLEHRLGLLWYWMICLGNKQRSFCHFWYCTQDCISDSFVEYEGYSISSKVFLLTVVDVMVIWVKIAHSSPF